MYIYALVYVHLYFIHFWLFLLFFRALTEVKEYLHRAANFIRSGLREVWLAVESYYTELFKDVIAFVDKATGIVKAMCDKNQDCKALVKSFKDEGWEGLCKQIQTIFWSIPGEIILQHVSYNTDSNPDDLTIYGAYYTKSRVEYGDCVPF